MHWMQSRNIDNYNWILNVSVLFFSVFCFFVWSLGLVARHLALIWGEAAQLWQWDAKPSPTFQVLRKVRKCQLFVLTLMMMTSPGWSSFRYLAMAVLFGELKGVKWPADLGEGRGGVGHGSCAHVGEGRGVPGVPGRAPVIPSLRVRREGDVRQSGLLGRARHAPVSLVEGGHVQLGPVVRAPEARYPARLADWRPLVHSVRVLLHVFGQIGLLNRDKFRALPGLINICWLRSVKKC